MPSVIECIAQYLDEELGVDLADIDEATPLFSEGIIDSFSLMSLVAFVEEAFGFRVGALDVNLANFDSLGRIARYIEVSRANQG